MRGSWIGVFAVTVAMASAAACGGSDTHRRTLPDSDAQAGHPGDGPMDASGTGGGASGGEGGGSGASSSGGTAGHPNVDGGKGGGAIEGGADAGSFVPGPPLLALGRQSSCALKLDQSVACWGRGDHGELGDGIFRTTPPVGMATPVAVSPLTSVVGLVAGQYHACALLSGTLGVRCWGAGFKGQLGDGVVHSSDPGSATPIPVALTNVVQLAAGVGDHTCALLGDKTVQCWGDNLFGQLGDDSSNISATPVAVKGLAGVARLAVGQFQSCALLENRTVECWGDAGVNASTGSEITNLTPVPIAGLSGVTTLVAGGDFSCALLDTGHVKCWGEGDLGQLGDGKETDSNLTPVDVQGLDDAVQLSAGGSHACALRANRRIACWGDGEFGQLGDGVFHNGFPNYSTVPVAVTAFTDAVEVACGGKHTCVRTSADKVACVGSGDSGQLGDGKFYGTLPFGNTIAVDALAL